MNLNKTVSLKITRHNKFPQKTFCFIGQDQKSKTLNRNFAQYYNNNLNKLFKSSFQLEMCVYTRISGKPS